jgi:hypothetical protein
MALRPTPAADDIAERLIGVPFHLGLDDDAKALVVAGLQAAVDIP